MSRPHQDVGIADGRSPPRPGLFLHIPKTAGTSFILNLQNVFGDNRVRRIHQVNAGTRQLIDDLVRNELASISCLTGHLPIHLLDVWLDRFQPFTVLREPVARVLSLYRFLKLSSRQELIRLHLPADFSLADFLSSRHPELHCQINNGMVRMLSGEPGLSDPDFPEFHDMAAAPNALAQALANLERMEFGLSEELGRTLAMIKALWSIPYELLELRENTTRPDGAGDDVNVIHQIIARNTMDLALYERAKTIFRVRVAALRDAPASAPVNSLTVFCPPPNQVVGVGDIPGRQGFHEFEGDGIAWLRADQPSEIRFVSRWRPDTAAPACLLHHGELPDGGGCLDGK